MEYSERATEAAILQEMKRNAVPVTVDLISGTQYQGVIAKWDVLIIVLLVDGAQKIIYKHSIASITPATALHAAQA